MKRKLMAGVAAIALIASAPAFADMTDRSRTTGGILMAQAKDAQQNDRMPSKSDTMDKHQTETPKVPERTEPPKESERTQAPKTGTPDKKAAQTERPDPNAEARQRLQAAKPITEIDGVSAETIIGTDVRNLQNEDIGDVEDVITDKGKLSALIVVRGGFLGMGASYYRVDIERVKATEGERGVVVLDMSADSLQGLSEVEKRDGKWIAARADDADRTPARETDTRKAPAETAPDENKQPAPTTPKDETKPAPKTGESQ